MWIFHGAEDVVVSPSFNRELYKGLIDNGARRVKYTEYPGVNHNSWDNAFAEPELLPWIMSKKKKKTPSW
jgi:predicted peptidase